MTRNSGWVAPGELPYSDRETSLQAAKDAKSNVQAMRTAILAFIRRQGTYGATDDEIEQALGLMHQSASARRRELFLAELVQPSQKRRPTRTGSAARVWVAVVAKPADPVQERLL